MGVISFFGLAGIAAAESAGPIAVPQLDQALAKYEAKTQVSGYVRIVGSDTMRQLMARLASEFNRRQSDAKINVQGGGSATALPEFLGSPAKAKPAVAPPWGKDRTAQPAMIMASSRELTSEEVAAFASIHGYEPTSVPVAMDAVAIYVHKDNPLQGLTLDQVDAIFSDTRKRGYPHEIKRWGQLGLTNGWENAQIRLYGRNQKSGTYGFFKEHALAKGNFDPALQEEPGAASVILALSRNSFGIAYSGMGLATSSVRTIPLAEIEGMPFVPPTAKSVMDGSYPLRRFLYLYLDKSPSAPVAPVVEEFLAFVKSRDGQEVVVKAGFYPLTYGQLEHTFAIVIPAPVR
jgi:phosphate transport system substrate-binding protein